MPHDPPRAGADLTALRIQNLDDQDSYTPVLTATTTDPNLGADGSATGVWHRNGHLITVWARIAFSGSGLDAGSGDYEVSLPFDADTGLYTASGVTGAASCIGSWNSRDNSVVGNSRRGVVVLRAAGKVGLELGDSASVVDDASPFVWAEGDRFTIVCTYLADTGSL